MPTWNPREYLKFADHRLRPAIDLMARIPQIEPRSIYDLGCGPGNVTRMLTQRWPDAAVTGVDSSPDMLTRAEQEAPGVAFQQADIAEWSAPKPADLLFSNATLHWLDDHKRLLPRLVAQISPGGALAVQMPCNRGSPSHLLIEATAAAERWRHKLSRVRPVYNSVETAEEYYRILSPVAAEVDIWETTYLHVLEGENPVAEWTKGTALRPYLDALDDQERPAFLADYAGGIADAYPRQLDGRTLLEFRRIFLIARV
jgi:trans-aconitate 2-methyltransferase